MTRRALLGATAATFTLPGCIASDDTGDSNEQTVQVSSHADLGDILVGPDGMTLYMFDSDTEGEKASVCYAGCAENWPPLLVEDTPTAGGSVTAELETFERDDGTTQVMAGGWPLYYFAADENPGDANGQGVKDVWWVLAPDGTPVKSGSETETEDGGDISYWLGS